MMTEVAALFVRRDSIYKTMPGVDAWDADRDARLWPGGCPVVAHPPCAQWGRLRYFAADKPDEKALGPLAVGLVRAWGGVLEHPWLSTLWPAMGLPKQGEPADEYGGFTLDVDQFWWQHRAQKRTLLYIVGVDRAAIAPPPFRLGQAEITIASSRRRQRAADFKSVNTTKAEREHTPPLFAEWLVSIARSARRHDATA